MHGDAAATNNLPTSTPGKEIQSIQLNPFKLLSKRSFSFYLANVVDILKKASNPTSTIIQNLRFSIFRNFTRNYIYTPHDQLIKLINYLYTEDIIICLSPAIPNRTERSEPNRTEDCVIRLPFGQDGETDRQKFKLTSVIASVRFGSLIPIGYPKINLTCIYL